jgi:hypothetical protein
MLTATQCESVTLPAEEGSAGGADLATVVAVLARLLPAHLAQQAVPWLPAQYSYN